MTDPALTARALAAAVAVAQEHGLRVARPEVLRDRSNLLVRLWPAPVVARVATRTGLVRSGDAWLAREVGVAGFLAQAGAPVVPPSAELPPGPHVRDGLALTFWTFVPEQDAPADLAPAGRALRECHAALASLDGSALPRLAAVSEAEQLLARLCADGAVGAPDARRLRAVSVDVRRQIEALEGPQQAVHGDAHPGNVLHTATGPLWNDWEDTFRGPRAWDLGCLRASAAPFGRRDPADVAAVLAGYGDGWDEDAVEACAQARRFQLTMWALMLARAEPATYPAPDGWLSWWR